MKTFVRLAALALLALLLLVGTLILRNHHDVELQPGEEQLFDDFGFSVLSARRSPDRCVVELRIVNRARRVPFRLDRHLVRLVDARGEGYLERRELATRPRTEIAPGEAVVEAHVFEVPDEAQGLVLALCWGPIPDFLDWLFDGRRTYRLP